MDVAAIRVQVHDWITDNLSGSVIGHVAAAAGLEHFNAARRELLGRGENVRAAVFLDADSDDVGMLQEEQRGGNAIGLAILDQGALQREAVRVGNEPESPHVERALSPERAELVAARGARRVDGHHTWDGSKFSRPFFTSAMNWSATAPSIRRWS